MAETAKHLYGQIIQFESIAPVVEKQKVGKNHDFARYEGRNGKVDPIRNKDDIERIIDYFYEKKQYRNWCMFIVGINCGLRVSDMIRLRLSDVANYDIKKECFVVKPIGTEFKIIPKKTQKTKKYVTVKLTNVACTAIQQYIDIVCEDASSPYRRFFLEKGWLFPTIKSSSPNSIRSSTHPKEAGDPIDEDSVGKDFKKCQRELGLNFNFGTHSMRKTFGYRFFRQYQGTENSQLALAMLQKIFQHSSEKITLNYIGISDEEVSNMLGEFDCGIDANNLVK